MHIAQTKYYYEILSLLALIAQIGYGYFIDNQQRVPEIE